MPSAKGPKIFHSRSSPPQSFTRKPATRIICLLFGITGLFVGLFAISRTLLGQNCKLSEPRSVSVVWERGDSNENGDGISDNTLLRGNVKRHKVMGFVGIFTGFGSVGRRKALRQTWLPSDRDGLQRFWLWAVGGIVLLLSICSHQINISPMPLKRLLPRLEEATGLAFRFIIGRTKEEWKMSVLRKEVSQHDDFILLDIEEEYSKLPYKTLAFFKAAYALFDSEFYVKADDDIYLRPDRLSILLAKERPNPQTYIGCMKKGPVFTDSSLKWYEPLSYMLGKEYFLHAYGPIYALSVKVVRNLVALRNDSFRMFSNEDVTIGSWMLAMNVNHENIHELCSPKCTSSSIAVWDIPRCSGLCDPQKKMLELHQMEECSGSPATQAD